MKKFLFILFLVLLSLSLSLFSLALGNEYTFSDAWNTVVFSQGQILTGSSSIQSGYISAQVISVNDGVNTFELGLDDSYSFKGSQYSGSRQSVFDLSLPVNISISNEQELRWNLYFLSSDVSDLTFNVSGVGSGSSTPINVTLKEYESGSLYNLVYSSLGGVTGSTEVYSASTLYCLSLQYQPGSGSKYFETINISISGSTAIASWVLGAMGTTDLVSLPSDVVEMIKDISNNTGLTNSRISALLTDLRTVTSQLNDIISSMSDSSSGSQGYYQAVLVPSVEIQEITQELTDQVSDIKQEVTEMKDVLSSVKLPSNDDVFTQNQEAEDITMDVLTSDPEVNNFFKELLNNSIVSYILIAVFGCALIGYILFGKKA